jgi:pimeloyl-ACP methyl ester carboxylesterase
MVALDMPGFGHSDQPERLVAPDAMGDFLALLIDEWSLGAPHIVGPDVGTAAALFLGAKAPEKVTSLSIGGGAVSTPIAAGGALEAVIGAPSLDDVRQLDARVNISAADESAAPQATEPEVHEDYMTWVGSQNPLVLFGTIQNRTRCCKSFYHRFRPLP